MGRFIERAVSVVCEHRSVVSEGEMDTTHLISDETPPRRMVSLCSVKTTSFARGYSYCPAPSGLGGPEGCGVIKKRRPGWDWVNF